MIDDTALSALDGLSNETLAGRLADQLKRQIVTGQLKPGQKLVEKEIAAAFKVSRTPLREALASLVKDGLAVGVAYRGIFVRRVDLVQAREIYEMRIGIEGLAAMFAARRGSRSDFERLQSLAAAMDAEGTGDDSANLKLLNERFHRHVAQASGNSLLAQRVDDMWAWVSLVRTSGWSATGRGDTSRVEHHAICEAICRRDEAEARRLAEEHVLRAWQAVEPFLERKEE